MERKNLKLVRTIPVYETIDYDMFVMNELNRDINKATIKNFIKDFETDGYCTLFPIVVKEQDGKYLIIKGHHRFTACKESNMPVYFTIDNTLTNEDLVKGEKTQNSFKVNDCIKIYSGLGNEQYEKYQQLINESGIPESDVRMLLFGIGARGGDSIRKIIDEKLIITETLEQRFRIRLINLNRLKNKVNLAYNRIRNFERILFILDDSELTLKFAKYLNHNAYDICRSIKIFKKLSGKTYEEDLREKLLKIKL